MNKGKDREEKAGKPSRKDAAQTGTAEKEKTDSHCYIMWNGIAVDIDHRGNRCSGKTFCRRQ